MDKQEVLMRAQSIQQEYQQVNENLNYISNQIDELETFKESLSTLIKSESNEMLASIGRGVYAKSELKEKKLFVEIGAGIIIRKNPEQVKDIIESQVSKLKSIKANLRGRIEVLNSEMMSLVNAIQAQKSQE